MIGVRATQEELEEKGQSHFEDYRFVSRTELDELGGEAFVGTPQLRAHAHGFFVDARLYKRSDLGVPLCRDAFTPSTRLVSISQ